MIGKLKILIIVFIGYMAIYHLLPYNDTFTNILYYLSDHGYKIAISLIIFKLTGLKEFRFAALYFGIKLLYHLLLLNKNFSEYLGAIKSEMYAGILTFVLLLYFIYYHETEFKSNPKNNT